MLTIRRTLAHGRLHGFVSGLGTATADGFYGAIAAFGLTFISDFLIDYTTPLRLIGAAFLFYLGLKTLLAVPTTKTADGAISGAVSGTVSGVEIDESLPGTYLSTFFLTITNPITILAFTAIFTGAGITVARGNYVLASSLVIGVFSGSLLWYATLSTGVNALRSRFTLGWMLWVNRLSGAVIIGFALLSLGSLL